MTRYHADLDGIKQLREALIIFASQQSDTFVAAEHEMAIAVQELEDAEQHWRNEAERRNQELQNCYAARLAVSIDCSSEEAAAREAEEKLSALSQWQLRVRDAILEYRAASQRFGSVLENEVPRACVFLNDRIKALEAYQATVVSAENQAVSRSSSDSSTPAQSQADHPSNPPGTRSD